MVILSMKNHPRRQLYNPDAGLPMRIDKKSIPGNCRFQQMLKPATPGTGKRDGKVNTCWAGYLLRKGIGIFTMNPCSDYFYGHVC
jgi:hypothetical protein